MYSALESITSLLSTGSQHRSAKHVNETMSMSPYVLWNKWKIKEIIQNERSLSLDQSYPLVLTLSSKAAIPMPLDAPDPASPTKCPLPILLANNEAPTYKSNVYCTESVP